MSNSIRTLPVLFATMIAGCGALLDFDDLDGLPCPCDPVSFVCINSTNICRPRNSVDQGKSCLQDTDGLGDELCPPGNRCQAVNGEGPRCLKTCNPVVPATPEAALTLAAECPPQQYCFDTLRGGVCSEGVCSDQTNLCPGNNQQCAFLNGAGVCFTSCRIYDTNPPPCGGGQACQPVADSRITACLATGTRQRNEPCDEGNLCAAQDEFGRGMVCERPMNSQQIRRCYPICNLDAPCVAAGEQCVVARPQIDPVQNLDLNICVGN